MDHTPTKLDAVASAADDDMGFESEGDTTQVQGYDLREYAATQPVPSSEHNARPAARPAAKPASPQAALPGQAPGQSTGPRGAMSDHGTNALESDIDAAREIARARAQIIAEIQKRIIGQERVVDHLLTALFARGHCLFVGVPGLAKTLLISTLAETLNLTFKRIQFTPDLMPSDITGTEVLEEDHTTGHRVFKFIQGPLFANLVLADEINRTPPKTQAALLQSMQEYQITAGGRTFPLALPFLVFATQNPIEQEGTYPLPEAQLDRFMFQVDVEYPSVEEEEAIVMQQTSGYRPQLDRVLSPERIVGLQELVLRVPVAEHVVKYAVALVRATRPDSSQAPPFVKELMSWGAGPRASQYLVLAGKARAILDGRFAVAVEDIQALAKPVLQHRLILNYRAEASGVRTAELIARLLESIRP